MPNYLDLSGELRVPDRAGNIYVLKWTHDPAKKGNHQTQVTVDGKRKKDMNPSQLKIHGRFIRERTKQRAGKAVVDITAGCRAWGLYNQNIKIADMNAAEALDYDARCRVRSMWEKAMAMADAIEASRRA